MAAEVLPWILFVLVLLVAVVVTIRTDPRTRTRTVPAAALSRRTALSDEIAQREEVLKASHQVARQSVQDLKACGKQLEASIARRGLR